jgi:hypothetical protein
MGRRSDNGKGLPQSGRGTEVKKKEKKTGHASQGGSLAPHAGNREQGGIAASSEVSSSSLSVFHLRSSAFIIA